MSYGRLHCSSASFRDPTGTPVQLRGINQQHFLYPWHGGGLLLYDPTGQNRSQFDIECKRLKGGAWPDPELGTIVGAGDRAVLCISTWYLFWWDPYKAAPDVETWNEWWMKPRWMQHRQVFDAVVRKLVQYGIYFYIRLDHSQGSDWYPASSDPVYGCPPEASKGNCTYQTMGRYWYDYHRLVNIANNANVLPDNNGKYPAEPFYPDPRLTGETPYSSAHYDWDLDLAHAPTPISGINTALDEYLEVMRQMWGLWGQYPEFLGFSFGNEPIEPYNRWYPNFTPDQYNALWKRAEQFLHGSVSSTPIGIVPAWHVLNPTNFSWTVGKNLAVHFHHYFHDATRGWPSGYPFSTYYLPDEYGGTPEPKTEQDWINGKAGYRQVLEQDPIAGIRFGMSLKAAMEAGIVPLADEQGWMGEFGPGYNDPGPPDGATFYEGPYWSQAMRAFHETLNEGVQTVNYGTLPVSWVYFDYVANRGYGMITTSGGNSPFYVASQKYPIWQEVVSSGLPTPRKILTVSSNPSGGRFSVM